MPRLNPIGLVFIVITILFTVAGQLMVKKGVSQIGMSPTQLMLLPRFVFAVFTNPYVFIGLLCAVGAAIAWSIAVSRVALSVAYPFQALAIVMVLLLSSVLFGEAVPRGRWLGMLIVYVGVVVAARA